MARNWHQAKTSVKSKSHHLPLVCEERVTSCALALSAIIAKITAKIIAKIIIGKTIIAKIIIAKIIIAKITAKLPMTFVASVNVALSCQGTSVQRTAKTRS